uniref:Uncharacterized protein n=1 Tax=Hyaloperonospora arabidopsidis (strain Emoy2) TaxID=559515 RepID=M4BKB7_HYAAE
MLVYWSLKSRCKNVIKRRRRGPESKQAVEQRPNAMRQRQVCGAAQALVCHS